MIITIIGMSGTGKSTIEERFLERHNLLFERIISDTTRDKRDYEIDGYHYNFISKEQFEQNIKNDEYAEYANFNGWYYGINKKHIDLQNKNYICVTNPKGYYNLKEQYGDEVLGIWIRGLEYERRERYMKRDGNADIEEWERRLITDEEDFRQIGYDANIHRIWNLDGKFDHTMKQVEGIVFQNLKPKYIEVTGKYNSAKIFTDNVEDEAVAQVINLCNQQYTQGSAIRLMPDIYSGKGCTIGTTMTLNGKVCPNLVGVDIGCGMAVYKLDTKEIDLEKLDYFIHNKIPSGFNVRQHELKKFTSQIDLSKLRCKDAINLDRAYKSLGSLGGGNHFIEVDKGTDGTLYLIIHSGSRHLGKQVCDYYQQKAIEYHEELFNANKKKLIADCKALGTAYHIHRLLEERKIHRIPDALAYLEGQLFEDYIHDMKIVQRYAELNREAMGYDILSFMELSVDYYFHTVHNYIDTNSMILRKGAVSAQSGETLLIPINMRDGSLLCRGKGNPDWNYSAPHGAGRLFSRKMAKELIDFDEFEHVMAEAGIYTTSVNMATLDEAPQAYKPIEDIVDKIGHTVNLIDRLLPIYNFKA